jgi:CHAD domain-containing protein
LVPVCCDGDVRAHSKAIRRIAQAAGAVRDRDVLMADLQARAASLGEPLAPATEALVAALREDRHTAHAALVAVLDSDGHAAFLHAFAATINTTACWDNAPRVRDLGGSTLWRHYEALRAHDRDGLPTDDEALHAMRIDGKRLRYVLELFADTLGTRAEEAVTPLVAFQDHLGALNDSTVARHLLAPHADHATTGPAVGAYLALREQESLQLTAALPAPWQKLNGGSYRRKLLELITRL